jgi:hypothetical protein
MRPADAAVLIARLSTYTTTLTALTPEEWAGTGLTAKRKLVNQETKQPIFIYVDRLELIELIRVTHQLYPKGHNICHTLNLTGKVGDTQ